MSFEVAGEAYDRFMGRYSRPLAVQLADLLDLAPGQRALDVGCGPGALTDQLVDRLGAEHVAAVDPSGPFVEACRSRHPGVDVRVATAEALPYDDGAFDTAAACLVVHFMEDPVRGLAEMARVTREGGWVAAAVWDLADGRTPMRAVWSAMAEVAPETRTESQLPGGSQGELVGLLADAGLRDVEGDEVAVTVSHPTFEEWWEPYLHGVGPVGEAVGALDTARRRRLEALLRRDLGDGPFDVTAVAFTARGRA